MRERMIILFESLISWFVLWYLLYGKANDITGVCLLSGEIAIPGVFLYLLTRRPRLSKVEIHAITCSYIILTVFNLYMILCLFSIPVWVYNHNFKIGIFIAINAIVYLYSTYRLSRENR